MQIYKICKKLGLPAKHTSSCLLSSLSIRQLLSADTNDLSFLAIDFFICQKLKLPSFSLQPNICMWGGVRFFKRTSPFAIEMSPNPSIDKFCVVQKLCATDFKAPVIVKRSVGKLRLEGKCHIWPAFFLCKMHFRELMRQMAFKKQIYRVGH